MINIEIEAPFKLKEVDKELINEKIQALDKFNAGITQADVYFKLDDGDNPNDVMAQVQLRVPGPELYAKQHDSNAMKAFTEAVKKVKAQLLERKGRIEDRHHKKS